MKYSFFLVLISQILSAAELAENVQQVVVSADRISPLSVGNSLSSSMIITQEEIQAKQYETIYQVLHDVPGVNVVATAPGQSASVFIRGEKSEQTLVLVDGMEFNDPTDPGRGADLGTLRMDNVERIEVIRGAQSVFYPGVGGVINIITKSGAQGEPASSISIEGGSFGTARSDFSMRGKSKEELDYSLTLGAFRTDAISSAASGTERDGNRSITFSGKFGKRFSSLTRAELIARYYDAKTDLDQVPADIQNFQNSQQNLIIRAQGLTRFGIWEPILGVGYRSIDRVSLNHSTTPEKLFDSNGGIAKADLRNRFYLNEQNILTWGLEGEHQSAKIQSNYTGTLVSTDQQVNQGTTYLQHEFITDDGFFSTTGARADYHSTFGWQPMFRAAPGFRLNATGTVFRAAAGTGFKAPSLYQLYGEYGTLSLKPEKSFSFDFGIEQTLIPKRSILIVTVFYNKLTDLVDFDLVTSKYINVGKAKTQGIEISQSTRILSSFKWETAYTFLETKDEVTGLKLLRRPRHRVSNTFIYSEGEFEAALTHSLVGTREDIDALTFTRKEMPLYQVVNLALDYRLFKNTLITARIENLFNSRYQVIDGYGTPGIAFYAGVKQNL